MNHIAQISRLNIADYTSAQLMADQSITIQAPPEKIWRIISDPTLLTEWMNSVKKLISFDNSKADADGVGGERLVVYGSGDHIKETVVYAERNKILAYRIAFPSMVKDHLSVIEITAQDSGASVVRLYAYFTPTEWTGYLMKYGVYAKIIRDSLKRLKAYCLK